MKRGYRAVLVIGGILFAAVLIAVLWPVEKEPEYHGKKLSEWLDPIGNVKKSGADEAVRHIGTNAIPWLLRWVADPHASEMPKRRQLLLQCISKLPKGLRTRLLPRGVPVDPSWRGKGAAANGFNYAEVSATSAKLALDSYLKDSDPEVRRGATNALSMCETYERRNQIFERAKKVQGGPTQRPRPYPKYPTYPARWLVSSAQRSPCLFFSTAPPRRALR